jgi:hypothetical protein
MHFHMRFIVHDAADARYMKQGQRAIFRERCVLASTAGGAGRTLPQSSVHLKQRWNRGNGALAAVGRTAHAGGSATADQTFEDAPSLPPPRTNCMSAALMDLQRNRFRE